MKKKFKVGDILLITGNGNGVYDHCHPINARVKIIESDGSVEEYEKNKPGKVFYNAKDITTKIEQVVVEEYLEKLPWRVMQHRRPGTLSVATKKRIKELFGEWVFIDFEKEEVSSPISMEKLGKMLGLMTNAGVTVKRK